MTITRVGSNQKFSDGWDAAFAAPKKSAGKTRTGTGKAKKAPAKKRAAASSKKTAAVKKKTKKKSK